MEKTTHYLEAGKGEPLILIHGVGLDSTIWAQQMEALSKEYRVISYDMMGHGLSASPPGPYHIHQFVKQLDHLLADLAIEKAHIVGFSMGGLVAQAFAAQVPEKVISLVIVSSVTNRTGEQRQAVLSRVQEVEQKGHLTTIDAAIQRWFTTDFMDEYPEVIQRIRHRLQSNQPDAYLAAYRVFATADEELYPQLPQILCPTLVVTGELDGGSTPEMARIMAEKIPHAQVKVLEGIRHMLPIEAVSQLNQILLDHLQTCKGRRESTWLS
ncbi:alpha/beta fold hydrolase [Ammoniphilus sp. YIM 78166]|uniref:alpha/beta fold hydrolase n=1 Tax=Ammoniphilus sp. YIM 78166 TaxID=1644106 RepID=UPI00106F6D3F|nr:alpha/beta fold hydrolase [Ammoniphilus sp. YIM 78166]